MQCSFRIDSSGQMRASYINKLQNHDQYVVLERHVPLPWTECKSIEIAIGQADGISKVVIDEHHHNLVGLADLNALLAFLLIIPQQGDHGGFALKGFKTSNDNLLKPFLKEIEINQAKPENPGSVQLLAAFEHRKTRYLVFSRAEGGSLRDVGENFSPRSSWFSIQWLFDECYGIADGVSALHFPSNSPSGEQGSVLIHADIKPENIICFKSDLRAQQAFRLRLADFGLTARVIPGPRVHKKELEQLLGYRPPEWEVEDEMSPKYDVWCLARLYLEFVTWAILGYKGIEKFEEELDKPLDPRYKTLFGVKYKDTLFKRQISAPRNILRPKPKIIRDLRLNNPGRHRVCADRIVI